jgi:hypothetical protein
MPLTYGDLGRLQTAAGALAGALQVDSVWTSLAAGPGQRQAAGVIAPATAVVDGLVAMRQSIEEAVRAAETIRDVVDDVTGRDPAFAELPQSLIDALESADGQVALDALDDAGNSLAALAGSGFTAMRSGRGEAMEVLLADLRLMLSGALAPGYLPSRFLCGLAKSSMAAGLVTVWVPPHAHAAAAVGLGAAVYRAAGCRSLEPARGERRRGQALPDPPAQQDKPAAARRRPRAARKISSEEWLGTARRGGGEAP